MEPDKQNTQPVAGEATPVEQPLQPAQGQQSASSVPTATQETPVAPKQSVKLNMAGLLEKYKTLPKNTKLLVVVLGIFVSLIVLLLVAGIIKTVIDGGGRMAVVSTPAPLPSAQPQPEVEITNPSRYATGSGVLKIEGDIDTLTKDMGAVDLRENNLRVPTLDFDIKF